MKVVKAGFEIINEKDQARLIERAARVCYKSEDKIKEGTDTEMIKKLIHLNHLAMLEHGNLCIEVNEETYNTILNYCINMQQTIDTVENKVPFLRFSMGNRFLVSGNMRAWIEFINYVGVHFGAYLATIAAEVARELKIKVHDFVKCSANAKIVDMQFKVVRKFNKLHKNERLIHEPMTVHFVCDRGVAMEIIRMRRASFANESTRYCNYSVGKYNSEITVIKPMFFKEGTEKYKLWKEPIEIAELAYMGLIDSGATAQEARHILPVCLKSEIVVTTTMDEWKHILALRACDVTGPAHPQMHEIMVPLFDALGGSNNVLWPELSVTDITRKQLENA